MSDKPGDLDSKDFLTLLGLDDIPAPSAEQEQPDDDQWLMDTIGAMSLLQQLAAMTQSAPPELDPPADANAVPDCVRDLLNLLKNEQENIKKTQEM